jgi:broad specificity phosphatase PhoE
MGRSTVIVALVVLLAWPAAALAQQTVILVRHAERADGGAGAATMTGAPADPPLSAAGEARAARLAAMLADAGITAIFTTEFRRTQDTAKPLAAKLGLKTEVLPAKDTAALASVLKASHARGVILVIGHSNTVPDVIKALGGRTVTMRDDEYDAMYILTPATGAVTVIRFVP